MTDQKQTPHFPCGPCPLQDELYARITEYRFRLKDMEAFELTARNPNRKNQAAVRILLVREFVGKLWDLYHLAQATLTQFNIRGKP